MPMAIDVVAGPCRGRDRLIGLASPRRERADARADRLHRQGPEA